MRAVMEAIHESGELTVPQIAQAKSVTRQHIQVLVNALMKAGLAATHPNPKDKRSPLVTLTKKGKATFARMRQREQALVADLTRALATCDLDATLATLAALHAYLESKLEKGESDV